MRTGQWLQVNRFVLNWQNMHFRKNRFTSIFAILLSLFNIVSLSFLIANFETIPRPTLLSANAQNAFCIIIGLVMNI